MKKEIAIESIRAIEVLDSRGNPTVQVKVSAGGITAKAIVPSGASTGSFEAIELRDNDKSRYLGKGVLNAVNNVNEKIAKNIVGMNVFEQEKIDEEMIKLDGTNNKENLGANAMLGVSLSVAKVAAKLLKMPLYKYIGGINAKVLPIPMMNILNGGKHSDNNLSIQEFMIVPKISKEFKENLRAGVEVYHQLKKVLKENGYSVAVGDEGGFAPNLENEEQAIEFIIQAIETAGYKAGENFFIALDVAATEMYEEAKRINQEGNYYFWKMEKLKSKQDMITYLIHLTEKYPIISIEDGLSEEDWEGWTELTKQIGKNIQLVGDDLFVTNIKRLKFGIKEKAANCILIKPNQIGTLTETLRTIETAKKAGYKIIISHRSGETEDTTISDIAVATNAGQIKTGAPCRTDRVAKYNRLLNIEESILLSQPFY